MPSIETTAAFFVVSLVLGFTPGPDNVFVVMQAASQGRKAGMLVVLGLCTGLVVHTSAISLGLAAVFAASAIAFTALKLAGATYLAWLAWQAFRAPVGATTSANDATRIPPLRLYARGIVMNVTNPKVVMFFLAFLPQFVDPRAGAVGPQLVWFGLVFIVATLVSFGTMTYLAGTFGQLLRGSPRAQRIMNRATALVFAGLALRLALSER